MKRAIKREWVKALKSGEYKQGEGKLLARGKYCCLGVLCNVLGYDNKDIQKIKSHGGEKNIGLSDEILGQVGLDTIDAGTLAEYNDSGNWTFEDIANYISKEL